MKEYKNILIIKMSSLGDVIHALPTLYALRQNYPNAKITWAVHPQFADILPGKPWIDEVILIDKKGLKSFRYLKALRRNLHDRHFDMCLDLQCIAKSALVAFLSGAPDKYGYWELREGSFLVNHALVGDHKYDHVIERYLDTVRALGGKVDRIEFPLPHDETSQLSVTAKLEADGIHRGEGYVVIALGARWTVKEWPLDHFVELINQMAAMPIVLIGAMSDKDKSDYVLARTTHPHVVDLTGRTSLLELVEVLRTAKAYVSADTGPLHIANALKVPLVALFGPTSPERTGPYGGDHVHIVISPTSRATVKDPLIDDPECMKQITVPMVQAVLEEVLHD